MKPQVPSEPLVDSFGRVHTSLRVSVTDRCNIRCFYCMPAETVKFKPRAEVLTFEEIERFVRAMVPLGIDRLRLTGGEPLVRQDLSRLVSQLTSIDGLREVTLTTNGLLLADHAQALRDAGLTRLNVSLDAITEANFLKITRRTGLPQVLEGIAAAQRVGFESTRINAVAIRGLTETEAVPLARFAREHGLELRFIEFMPLDAEGRWNSDQVLDGEQLRALLGREISALQPADRPDPSQPAVDYRYEDGRGRVGFINPVSQPFCNACNRLRITADGRVRNCLFSTSEWDARALLRGGEDDEAIRALVRDCVWHKKPAHGIDEAGFQRPERAMYQIGG